MIRVFNKNSDPGSQPRRASQMAMGVHMEKDPEPALDAIATWFSSMLDNVSALTSWCSQIASLGLCRARIEGWRVVLPSSSRALSQPRPDRWLQPPQTHALPHLTPSELRSTYIPLAYPVSLAELAENHLFYCLVPHQLYPSIVTLRSCKFLTQFSALSAHCGHSPASPIAPATSKYPRVA